SGKSTTIAVWVLQNTNIPHFTGNGQIVNRYIPQESLFVVAPFVLQPSDLQSDPSLVTETRKAAVNTLYSGFYPNLVRNSLTTTWNDWLTYYTSEFLSRFQWAAQNGFHMLTMGDDGFRNIGTDAWPTLNWPFGRQAIQYAVSSLARTGAAISIEGIDEAS